MRESLSLDQPRRIVTRFTVKYSSKVIDHGLSLVEPVARLPLRAQL